MQKMIKLAPLMSTLLLAACASPSMDQMPKQQPGKGIVIAYSSTLNPTSSLSLAINRQSAGDIQGSKVKVVYLAPGEYTMTVAAPNSAYAVNQSVNVKPGQYYFYNAFTTTTRGAVRKTTYHLEPVNQEAALQYLQGPVKFTGWGDLATNAINGKRIW